MNAKTETRERLAERAARLEAENEALLDLLAAVRETADVPEPGDDADLADWELLRTMESRAVMRIASWLRRDPASGGFDPGTASRIRDRAGLFRATRADITPSYAKEA